ncbi:substrate-binding periplasmic protein [Curvivirga aplysinae]|uniref:substrate-binding periplasmic protein n=1 Tax=Curvivirga aplysinae TaxID=2529852 RepID=UPI0012BC02DB|nr:transporter substrate-binding domain-containing protein [Curvivirga aplysinae]MTI10332.1 transporter substrate-binding domain-containing protein [Curvivirga aplysinae]
MRLRLIILILINLFMFKVHSVVHAETLIVSGEYAPYSSANMLNDGLTSELVKRVFKEMGHKPRIVFRPWQRGYNLTKRGDYVGTFPYYKNPEREKEFLYSDPIVSWESYIFFPVSAPLSSETLLGKTECLPFHYASTLLTHSLYDKGVIKREKPATASNCWNLIVSDRVDFFIEDALVAKRYLETLDDPIRAKIGQSQNNVSQSYGYMIFPKSQPESEKLREAFNIALKHLGLNLF